MIRRIENHSLWITATGIWVTFDTPVDPNKVVIMLWGEGMNHTEDTISAQFYAYAWNVPPIWQSLNSSSVQVIPSMTVEHYFDVNIQVIEYI